LSVKTTMMMAYKDCHNIYLDKNQKTSKRWFQIFQISRFSCPIFCRSFNNLLLLF
jgi:hypothetical protein